MSTTLTEPATEMFDVGKQRFSSHLLKNATRFFPELDESALVVNLRHHAKREHSQLLELEVSDGKHSRNVIYKIPFCLQNYETNETSATPRPRLFPEIAPITNGLREYRALESIEAHFNDLDSTRFGVVSMLDLLESPYVLVMEKCKEGDLKSLMKRATRFHKSSSSQSLHTALANTGEWLREFHLLEDLEHTEVRHAERESFVDAVERFSDGLIQQLGRHSYFERLCRKLVQAAKRHLPDEIPLAVVHGDFAPRNILVDGASRVTVFDTQRRWRAPLYEDLAYFLMSLKTPGPQVRTQGLLFSQNQLAEWEAAFLAAYFEGSDTPFKAVRLYETLLTIEWWGAINFRLSDGSVKQRASLALSNRYLSRYVKQLTAQL